MRVMRGWMAAIAFGLGLVVGACAEPEEEDLGSFPCGNEDCDVRSEYCSVTDQCDGSQGQRSCQPVPDECNGMATTTCLSTGGLGCGEGEHGGISCSPSCG